MIHKEIEVQDGVKEKSRGLPHHLQKYYPPLGWNGYGLRVSKEYDNGDDTWLGYSNVEGE